jgi:outer membrane lipoprotein SlyB
MEATQNNTRLHPLLTAAAISITVFSAVGVAAITGLVPASIGSAKPEPVLEVPKPVEPAITHPVPAATPAPNPARKPAVQSTVRKPPQPVVYRDFAETGPVAQAQPAPKPVVDPATIGVVQGVREVTQKGEHTLLGPAAGAIAGAVIGNQFGHGNGRKIMTVVGAAGGGLAGREIEKHARATKHWEIDVRLDNGAQQAVKSEAEPYFKPGDRVRLIEGRLQPA